MTPRYEMVYRCDQGDFSTTSYERAAEHEEALSVHHVWGQMERVGE